jgi:hypothetical protein
MHEHVTKAHKSATTILVYLFFGAHKGYLSHFNLEFQTGAFLQLILTLTAISSRIAILLTEIQPTIELACRALHSLLCVLHVSCMECFSWRRLYVLF